MAQAIVITPVKDSLETTKTTIDAVTKSDVDVEYYIFNDFSQPETKKYLDDAKEMRGFQVVQMAQSKAIAHGVPLIIIESDVIVKPNTISQLLQVARTKKDAGMIAAITVDCDGNYNFPYLYEKRKSNETKITTHSLSFCCTLITNRYLNRLDFKSLSPNKDWYDVFISKQSRKLGFKNYLSKGNEVIHLPHSSRPWKNLKYSNPILYYLKKLFLNRDRI